MTGSTSTSIWKNYQNGVRNYCGHVLPEGMIKNQKLETILLTPTTKEEEHDRPISAQEIINEGWMTKDDFDVCANAVLEVFKLGQQISAERGLILVDTKFELGKDDEGNILLIDEVLTPDSSRYWLAESYNERMSKGLEPENIDKEFLRLWFANNCDPYKDEEIPDAPKELVLELSRKYILLYEIITSEKFEFQEGSESLISKAIEKSM
jgi:phosphoribosylaminoimidazole-succinocarboxamide synthase